MRFTSNIMSNTAKDALAELHHTVQQAIAEREKMFLRGAKTVRISVGSIGNGRINITLEGQD